MVCRAAIAIETPPIDLSSIQRGQVVDKVRALWSRGGFMPKRELELGGSLACVP